MKKSFSVLILCAALALASCGKKESAAAGGANPKADSMKTAYMAIITAFETGNAADVDKYVAPNTVNHQKMPGEPDGIDGLKKMIVEFKAAMPDSKYTVEDMRVDGDILVARVKMSGTNSGPMMGMPATNKKVTDMMFIDWVRWDNGKFVEHWGVGEDMKMMEQLGMLPPMAPPPAADSTKK